jgi:hypothetical protein
MALKIKRDNGVVAPFSSRASVIDGLGVEKGATTMLVALIIQLL